MWSSESISLLRLSELAESAVKARQYDRRAYWIGLFRLCLISVSLKLVTMRVQVSHPTLARGHANKMTDCSIVATRELCEDLYSLVELAKQSRAPVRAISLVERACAELHAYLDEIDGTSRQGLNNRLDEDSV